MFYLLGIVCAIYYTNQYIVIFSLFVFTATIITTIRLRQNKKLIKQANFIQTNRLFILFSFLFLGYSNAFLKQEFEQEKHYNNNSNRINKLKIKLKENPIVKQNSYKLIAEVISIADKEKTIRYRGKIICYFAKDSSVETLKNGDIIYINASANEITEPKNPGEFNYKKYLANRNISHQVYIAKNAWKRVKENNNIFENTLFKTKKRLQYIINNYIFEEDERAVASALLLGNKDLLSDDIMKSFSSTGATHILAVSGLHVGIFYTLLSWLFKILLRFKKLKILHPIIIIAGIWFYVILTGGSPSVTRAATMFSFIAIGQASNRYVNIYNIIAFSAFIICTINPYIITDVGFQLSYFAVIGIIFMYQKIYGLFAFSNYLGDKIWAITAVSIAAQIATFPLAVYYFHQFPNLFWLANPIVIPAAFIIVSGGITMFLFSWNEAILILLGKLLSYAIQFLNYFLSTVEKIPYALTSNLYTTALQTLLLYLAIIFMITALSYRNKKLMTYALISSLILSISLSFDFVKKQTQKELIVYHIPNHSAIEIIDGNTAHSYFDTALQKNENTISYRIAPNWGQKNIKKQVFNLKKISQVSVSGNKVYLFNNKKIMIIDQKYKWVNSPVIVDYAIISQQDKLNIKNLSKQIKASSYIFDSSNKKYKEKYWKQDCESLGLSCYFVSDSVAYQTNI